VHKRSKFYTEHKLHDYRNTVSINCVIYYISVRFKFWSKLTEHLANDANVYDFFYVLLTVHLSIILVINQLNAQILVL